jgi:hypothetical protein
MEKELEKIKETYADCNLTDEEAMEIYKAEHSDSFLAGTIFVYRKCPARIMFSGCRILK